MRKLIVASALALAVTACVHADAQAGPLRARLAAARAKLAAKRPTVIRPVAKAASVLTTPLAGLTRRSKATCAGGNCGK